MCDRRKLAWILFFVCFVMLLQIACCRPRLRHSHKKFWCSKCPPGWGVLRPCTETADTVCEPCSNGRYSPHHSYHNQCWLCSRCGAGLYEAHTCRPAADTVCDSCHRAGATDNKDFLLKCMDGKYRLQVIENNTLSAENG